MVKVMHSLLEEVVQSRAYRHQTSFDKAINGYWWERIEAGSDLLKIIKSDSMYEGLSDRTVVSLGYTRSEIQVKQIVDWLIDRAHKVGIPQATLELDGFIGANEVDAYAVVLLGSVLVEKEYTFCNGVKLIGSGSIPNSYVRNMIKGDLFSLMPHKESMDSALIKSYKQNIHVDIHEKDLNTQIDRELSETRMCLSLARPVGQGVHAICNTYLTDDDVPMNRKIYWFSKTPKPAPMSNPMIEIEMKKADDLLEKYRALPLSYKKKLEIPIEWLNGFSSGAGLVDRAICLRVCLEAAFLAPSTKSKQKRVSLRAGALLRGEETDERKVIVAVKEAYDSTSRAVHEGVLPNDCSGVLKDAAEIARKAIVKFIYDGEIDWGKLNYKDELYG